MAEIKIIVLHETAMQSIISDAGTFVMVTSLCLIGWWLEVTALKFIGGLMAFTVIVAKTLGRTRMSISEARDHLDKIERGEA